MRYDIGVKLKYEIGWDFRILGFWELGNWGLDMWKLAVSGFGWGKGWVRYGDSGRVMGALGT